MNRSILPGLVLVAAGALLMLVPYWLLPVCDGLVPTASGGAVPMKCFWTARSELGAGALVALGGVLYCLCSRNSVRLGIALMTAGAAALAVALPTLLIGVCASETMPCRMGTLPALVLVGATAFVVSLLACRQLVRAMKREKQ